MSVTLTSTYYIAVMTTDKFGAGTDANVYLQMVGANGKRSPELYLKKSLNHTNKFERARTDVFRFKGLPHLGAIKQVRVWHDNSGPGAGWHLDKVEVTDGAGGKAYMFDCKNWLARDEGDGSVERTLPMSATRVKKMDVEDDD